MPAVRAKPRVNYDIASSTGAVSLFMVYQFLKRLVTPFNQWPAYHAEVIDERGNIILKARDRHKLDQKRSFSKFDLLALKIKRLLEKVPGGRTRLASYAAALYLIKEEWNHNNIEELENVEISEEFMALYEEVANAVGSGAIAGGGYNGPDDVKVTKKKAKKYKEKNAEKAPKFRAIAGVGFQEELNKAFEEFERLEKTL